MSNLNKSLYLANNSQLDLLVYKEIVPFFKAKSSYETKSLSDENEFMEYEALSSNAKRIFRDLVYEQYNELESSRVEFIQLVNFLDFVGYNRKEFLPLFYRYLHNHKDDKQFMKATCHIHRCPYYFYGKTNIKNDSDFFFNILGLENPKLEDIKNLTQQGVPEAIHIYAIINRDDNPIESRRLFKLNWEENNDIDSLNNYARMLKCGEGGEKDEVEARRLFLLSWNQYRNRSGLFNYAVCLRHGIGGEINEKEARRLFKLNWDVNKFQPSLFSYELFLDSSKSTENDS